MIILSIQNLIYYANHELVWVNSATPLLTQWESGMSIGTLTIITKLVECPVVLNTPLRAKVLYKGASYTFYSFTSSIFIGFM